MLIMYVFCSKHNIAMTVYVSRQLHGKLDNDIIDLFLDRITLYWCVEEKDEIYSTYFIVHIHCVLSSSQ